VVFAFVALSLDAGARMRNVFADHLGVEPVGDGERRVDPAVRVHDVAGHALDDAVDGIADILA